MFTGCATAGQKATPTEQAKVTDQSKVTNRITEIETLVKKLGKSIESLNVELSKTPEYKALTKTDVFKRKVEALQELQKLQLEYKYLSKFK
jgi:Fic family protein